MFLEYYLPTLKKFLEKWYNAHSRNYLHSEQKNFMATPNELAQLVNPDWFNEHWMTPQREKSGPFKSRLFISGILLLSVAALAMCTSKDQSKPQTIPTSMPPEPPATLTPEGALEQQSTQFAPGPEIVTNGGPITDYFGGYKINIYTNDEGKIVIQTGDFKGTCKVVYLKAGEALTTETIDNGEQSLTGQDCQVNRNPDTAMTITPNDIASKGAIRVFFIVWAHNGNQENEVRDITDFVFPAASAH